MESLFNTVKSVPLNHYILLSSIIFSIGVIGVLIRRNAIVIFMSVELMLNSVNLLLTAFSVYRGDATGQVFVPFGHKRCRDAVIISDFFNSGFEQYGFVGSL